MDEDYSTYKWKGQTRYRCEFCQFDSYLPELIEKHVREIHRSANRSILLNATGQPFENPFEQ